jgi:hypothetical protein
MNPFDVMARLAGFGLLGVAALVLGFVCVVGVMLGVLVAVTHLIRGRRADDRGEGAAGPDEEPFGLASFHWEAAPDPREAHEEPGALGGWAGGSSSAGSLRTNLAPLLSATRLTSNSDSARRLAR